MSTAINNDSLPAALRPAVVDLLYRLGDDGLLIGHRNSEWTGIGPILEEDIAFSSVAQDKMGHALAFYNLLHALGEPEPDQIAFFRDAAHFRACSLVALECHDSGSDEGAPILRNNPTRDRLVARGDWALALVRQFFFSEADAVRFEALASSTYEPLAQLVRKFRGEIKYHTMHGRSMMRKLAGATDDSRARIQHAVDALWPHALGIFEPVKHDAALLQAGISPTEADLCTRWRDTIEPMLRDAGLRVPTDAAPIYGGRAGRHLPELTSLLDDMQKVARMEPAGKW